MNRQKEGRTEGKLRLVLVLGFLSEPLDKAAVAGGSWQVDSGKTRHSRYSKLPPLPLGTVRTGIAR